jgi:hypothetical protein
MLASAAAPAFSNSPFFFLWERFCRPVSYLPAVKAFLLPNQALLVLDCAQWGFQPPTVIVNVIIFFVFIIMTFNTPQLSHNVSQL